MNPGISRIRTVTVTHTENSYPVTSGGLITARRTAPDARPDTYIGPGDAVECSPPCSVEELSCVDDHAR
jgi:hypothetical protein